MKQIKLNIKVSEKTHQLLSNNKYVFLVDKSINKIEMQQYIEKKYNVTVTGVSTMIVRGKKKRIKGIEGRTKTYKKFIVSLLKDQEIKEIKEAF